ncbi:hypothetical protein Tco_0750038 [Tanacetum coccineum]|uniref:Uncharacterized protein n=1 Tax=Tanacetum coccineum TaxID=301880 RepID=A0ABQ4Z2V3_9ASTR
MRQKIQKNLNLSDISDIMSNTNSPSIPLPSNKYSCYLPATNSKCNEEYYENSGERLLEVTTQTPSSANAVGNPSLKLNVDHARLYYLEMVAENTQKTPQESASVHPATKHAPPKKTTTTTFPSNKPSHLLLRQRNHFSSICFTKSLEKGKAYFPTYEFGKRVQEKEGEGDDADIRDQAPHDSTTGPSSQPEDDTSKKVIHESSSTSDSERTESETKAAAPKGDKDQVTSTPPVIAPFTDVSSTKPSSLVTADPPTNHYGSTQQFTTSLLEITPFIALQLRVARLEQEMSEVKKNDHSVDLNDDEWPFTDQPWYCRAKKNKTRILPLLEAFTSTVWQITDTRDAAVDSSTHRSDPESKHSEQSSDNIPMQDEGHVSDMEDMITLTFPRDNWANTYATTYQVPAENKLQRKTYDIGSSLNDLQKAGKKKLCKADLEGPAFNLVKAFHKNSVFLQFQMDECHNPV